VCANRRPRKKGRAASIGGRFEQKRRLDLEDCEQACVENRVKRTQELCRVKPVRGKC